ncbi:MBL fold metallo-hydrolase [Ensifer sp. 4252]|uniref:MBL fold metallo-hydrolase n=1 Tax=Ensifer sp. 4252 TaxID=3373915 RepID=UPI003D231229
MEYLFDTLYGAGAERLSFAPDFTGRAFVLRRPGGNLLVYASRRLAEEAGSLLSAGATVRQYINHHHQAMPSCDWASGHLDAPLFGPELERRQILAHCRMGGSFADREAHFPDFEVIPTPGHTAGSACFLWDNGQHRHLFSGDTIYLTEGRWIGAVLPSSDRVAYLASLALIKTLSFDVLVPSLAKGQPFHQTDARETQSQIDAMMRRLERGADG